MKNIIIILISVFILSSCWKVITEDEWIQYCKNKWQELSIVYTPFLWVDQNYKDINCYTPKSNYEKCLQIMRDTFSDLSDTWGNNTNNQDSISKTMSTEINRCLKNITPN